MQCLLVSKDSKSCVHMNIYYCTGSGSAKDCQTCVSTNYISTALAEDKCGNTEISYSKSDCPDTS